MKSICFALLCIALVGCQKSNQEVTADQQPESSTEVRVSKALGEAEARSAISQFVNAQLEGKTFVDAGKQSHSYPRIEPGHWRVVELKDERWIARLDPPDGVWATVSIDSNGKNPKLEGYGFAPN